MPKIDFSKGISFDKNIKDNRKELASNTTKSLLGDEATLKIIAEAKIFELPVDEIDERDINEFEDISLITLKESIINTGIQHNIVVRKNKNRYYVISGNRRLRAMKQLHAEYPLDLRFQNIPAKICQIIGEGEPNLNYAQITKEQEEIIYRDTNFENRQLSIDTAIKHIDYLVDKIENSPEFFELAYKKDKTSKKTSANYSEKEVDKAFVISKILTEDLGFKGWSKTSVWRLLKIREKDPTQIKAIADGLTSINTVYSKLYPSKKKEKEKYIGSPQIIKQLENVEENINNLSIYSDEDIIKIKHLLDKISNDIIKLQFEKE